MGVIGTINFYVAGFVPAAVWDWLQISVGMQTIMLVLMQRAWSPIFQTERINCIGERITVRIGQNSLVVLGVLGLLLVIDGAQPDIAPARTMVIFTMLTINGIQVRVLHDLFMKKVRRDKSAA